MDGSSRARALLVWLVAVGLLLASCDTDGADETTVPSTVAPTASTTSPTVPPETTTTSSLPTPVVPVGMELSPFGALPEIPLLGDGPPYVGPATTSSVLLRGPFSEASMTPAVESLLNEFGFGVRAAEWNHFWHIYESLDYARDPVFVTTDAAYHSWHLVFDKVLRDIEEQRLLPTLESLVSGLVERARAQRVELSGTPLADTVDRVAQLFEATATVLELDVGPIGSLAQQEVELILNHSATTSSPTAGDGNCPADPSACVQYALFEPRGHYTRSPDLERYFRAMSVFGNIPFPLTVDSLRVGALASRVLLSDPQAVEDWQLLYETTAFIVGAADDYTPFELATAAADVTPDGLTAPVELSDPPVLSEVAERLSAMRPVLINPERASMRLMGVRFTLDAFIIDRLVAPAVPERFEASALDVAAAFGSDWALGALAAGGLSEYDGYAESLAELRDLVGGRSMSDWGRTVYDAWLYALEPMWAPHGAEFPEFMRTEAWAAKAHQTGLGSYTELKHDTILYTKQALAEGGDGDQPPPPRHWVEPDPVAFERIAATAGLLGEGLSARGLLSDRHAEVLGSLRDWLGNLSRIARDELAGRPISEEDNLYLGWTGGILEGFWLNTADLDLIGEDGGPDEEAALVADILTSARFGALEVATGRVDEIYVLVPGFEGMEVAVGGVYSFYEFWQDPLDRLNDEEWRRLLSTDSAPDRPSWQSVFVAG